MIRKYRKWAKKFRYISKKFGLLLSSHKQPKIITGKWVKKHWPIYF